MLVDKAVALSECAYAQNVHLVGVAATGFQVVACLFNLIVGEGIPQ